jgi:dihydroflavonol-4-reductase
MASPFIIGSPSDEDELVKPAVEGTLNALRAAHKHKVKRVVITSSVAAVSYKVDLSKVPYNEESWTPVEEC